MAANTKYAVYKIFNGTDFDTIYFKAPAKAITESDEKQFISKDDKTLITDYLKSFNTPDKLVQLNDSGKIPSDLINEDFKNYLDRRQVAGRQTVSSEVWFTHDGGVSAHNGINLTSPEANDASYIGIKSSGTSVILNLGKDVGRQEITFTREGALEFKKETEIKRVKLGADDSAVPKSYVDMVIESGAKPIASVKAASTNPLQSPPSGLSLKIDDISAVAGDRFLIMNQENTSLNGIYVASTGIWTKDTIDSDLKGALVFVEKGTVNNDSKWFYEGGNEWIKFSQTDQLQFNSGLVRQGDDVKLTTDYITDDHIKEDAAIHLDKLGTHSAGTTGWDDDAQSALITEATTINQRLADLAMTIYRIRGMGGAPAHYGQWNSGSLTLKKANDAAAAKQNPVRYGTAAPSTTNYKDGDVYLHTDS